jgi:hypothetical protein
MELSDQMVAGMAAPSASSLHRPSGPAPPSMVRAWRNRTVPASRSRSAHSRPHSSPLRAPVAAARTVQTPSHGLEVWPADPARKVLHRGQCGEVDRHGAHLVAPGRLDDVAACRPAGLAAAAAEDHLGAHPGQLPRGFLAHPAVGAGDQRNAPGKVRLNGRYRMGPSRSDNRRISPPPSARMGQRTLPGRDWCPHSARLFGLLCHPILSGLPT